MRPFRLPPAYRLHFFRLSSGIHSSFHDFSFLRQSRTVLSFYIKTGRHCSFHPLPQYLPVKTKTALETLSLTIYSLSMGTAILIDKTFLTSEYKPNSRIRHYWSGLLNAFFKRKWAKSITHILYRFSVLSSIYICVVSMNLYYILCKYTTQYNMLIHDILHSLISTEGTFHFVVYWKTGITGVFRSETPSLYSLTWNRRLFSCFHISSVAVILLYCCIFTVNYQEPMLHRKGWCFASLYNRE